MPVIPEESEMEEFVNWDHADPAVGAGAFSAIGTGVDMMTHPLTAGEAGMDLDLALENVEGDDFSFWALQHYENSTLATVDPAVDLPLTIPMASSTVDSPKAFEESFETPDAPCENCQRAGYQCKKIREGKYKGYCTSCVALRKGCSFGLASESLYPTETTFPYNPWPKMGDHPDAIPQEDIMPQGILSHNTSASDLTALGSLVAPEQGSGPQRTPSNPKIGARFSRESVRILKNWLSTHNRHPYPNEDEKEMLQKQTGLNKTQITNWLANARRRGKIVAPRSTSPGIRSFSNAIDIPQRRGTPAHLEHMNPLQRWQNSPPEHEPASVTAIARAVTASSSTLSSGLNSPYSLNFTDDGSGKSLCAGSSASSVGTSQSSGGSFASAYSHGSRGSLGSLGSSMHRGRRRRRRKAIGNRPEEKSSLTVPLKTFQCTFCTETFRTKHDWQRHEKSLHLSLERWVCAPDGPRTVNSENGQVSCVFCGQANPSDAHCESHNHSACQERSLEERTFYRKDHLRQHLKLVHNVKFLNWSMEPWKVASPEIRSRCGFCGIVMDSWTIRVDHLAEHFKTGYSMADWKGDWGFEAPVLEMVENSIPPYLIHDERNTPFPFEATQGSPESWRNAYELLKSELAFFIVQNFDGDVSKISDEELQHEAARVIFGAEVLSQSVMASAPSWLRDLVLSNDTISRQARLAPIKSAADSGQAMLKINGKDNIFEDDSMEKELHEYVKARRMLGLTAMDGELQVEACKIIGRMEESSSAPSDDIANFLVRLIYSSTMWLANFRQRAGLPRSEDLEHEAIRSTDKSKVDSTIHNYSRLEMELADFVKTQRAIGVEPSDAALQRQARIIIYEFDDEWNQTAADNLEWLHAFKQRHLSSEVSSATLENNSPLTIASLSKSRYAFCQRGATTSGSPSTPTGSTSSTSKSSGLTAGLYTNSTTMCPRSTKLGSFFLNDANCYRRLARELGRFVASTMSPNNPNSHVPSDEELQHQARWILYDTDDPWNQTAADNAEWLRRFKVDTGIIKDPSLPGLPDGPQWSIAQGGTGFAPPYASPHPGATFDVNAELSVSMRDGGPQFNTEASTANKFVKGISSRMDPPAVIFCSRELEKDLTEFVVDEVALFGAAGFPSDEALKQKARDIVKTPTTAADDNVLLEKFKAMMREKLTLPSLQGTKAPIVAGTSAPAVDPIQILAMPVNMDLGITDSEITDILQEMDFDFGDMTDEAAFLDDTTLSGQ
ncbi:hypothetical protein GQ53DRAFT_825088 [Thozetella sp. PMI_491]|nr:hypothetical protein GQ53DRAFT_825088 [Thozetella sp. PMI_491]